MFKCLGVRMPSCVTLLLFAAVSGLQGSREVA